MSETSKKQFYVYIYRLLDGTPIYVGKGCGTRFRQHFKPSETSRISRKLRKTIREEGYCLYPEIKAVGSDEEARVLEMKLIKEFGRENLKEGPLYNLTDGGEGASGRVLSEDSRRKIGDKQVGPLSHAYGKPRTEEVREKIRKATSGANHYGYGLPRSEETKQKISKTSKEKGFRHSPEQRLKFSLAKRGELHPSYGKPLKEETRKKLSQALIGIPKKEYQCNVCGRKGRGPAMFKHHFTNCKRKGPDEPGQS